jgi:hypothetical protein
MRIEKVSDIKDVDYEWSKYELCQIYKDNVDANVSDYALELMKVSDLKRSIAITVFYRVYGGKANKIKYMEIVSNWIQCSFFSLKLWVREKPKLFSKSRLVGKIGNTD